MEPTSRKPIPVIIDTDPGCDDTIAILLALASPELDIRAIITCFGNSDLEANHTNVFKIYEAVRVHLEQNPQNSVQFPNFNSHKKPILARGSAIPLQGSSSKFTAEYFHGRDGLGDISKRHPELGPGEQSYGHQYLEISNKSGAEVVFDVLRSHEPRTVTYIVLGPMTNLATMMRLDRSLVSSRIGRVVSMGGALDVPGNTSPVAEFNYFADPLAVKELLLDPKHRLPLERFLMLPLDITTPHELPFPIYKEKVDPAFHNTSSPSVMSSKPHVTHFTSSFLERTREIMLQFGKDAMELHDIVAVWCAIANPPFPDGADLQLGDGWEAHYRVFDVETAGELTRGMLVVDRREDASAYPLGTIRSEAQREPHEGHSSQTDKSDKADIAGQSNYRGGVPTVYSTPGPSALLQFLFKRVWGVEI